MYDLHLHSIFSDGDLTVYELLLAAKDKGLIGLSLTDHDGLWGITEMHECILEFGLVCLEGIEISTMYENLRIHVLGYSHQFQRETILGGLSTTRQGHHDRIQAMVIRCHNAGYTKISFEDIKNNRVYQQDPSFVTYDVERQLLKKYNLSVKQAHELTTPGGLCFEPYQESWSLSVPEAIDLIHRAGGLAILAHPGIIAHESSQETMWQIISTVAQSVDGLEVHHPFHSTGLTKELADYATKKNLLITGGSDWHGFDRYDNQAFGKYGINQEHWQCLSDRLSTRKIVQL